MIHYSPQPSGLTNVIYNFRLFLATLAAAAYSQGTGRIHQPSTLPRRIWNHTPLSNQDLSGYVLPELTSETEALIFYEGFRNSL